MGARNGRVDLPDGTAAFYGARWKMVLVLLGSLAFVVTVVSMLAGGASLSTAKVVLLAAGAAFFLACAVAAVVRLWIDAPTVVVTASEVFVTSLLGKARIGVGLDQIAHVVLWKASHNNYVGVVLRPEAREAASKRVRRSIGSHERFMGVPAAFGVVQVQLRSPVDEVAAEISARCGRPVVDLRKGRGRAVAVSEN